MANAEHLARVHQGVEAWNAWRQSEPEIDPDLSEADLTGRNLTGMRFWKTNFSRAILTDVEFHSADLGRANFDHAKFSAPPRLHGSNLREAILTNVDLKGVFLEEMNLTAVDLSHSCLCRSDLSKSTLLHATLIGTRLRGAHMNSADLRNANFTGADLTGASLRRCSLIETNFTGATLTGCDVYGISAWDVILVDTHQSNLVVVGPDQAPITIDDLEVAQFLYVILNNRRLRNVINTVTSKVVLILGRFTTERKPVLERIRDELRPLGYIPVLFDFDPVVSQTRLETVLTLANMARFVIADLTDAKTVLQELQAIVPARPSLPVQPILLTSQKEPGMFDFFLRHDSLLPTVYYEDAGSLLAHLKQTVIDPADSKANDLIRQLDRIRRTG